MKKNSSICSHFYTPYTAGLFHLGRSFLPHLGDMVERHFIWSFHLLIFLVTNTKANQTSANPVIYYILWYTTLKKNYLVLIEHWVFNFQSSLCKEHYQHYTRQKRNVKKQVSKSEITKEIKPPESSCLLTYLENLHKTAKKKWIFLLRKAKG